LHHVLNICIVGYRIFEIIVLIGLIGTQKKRGVHTITRKSFCVNVLKATQMFETLLNPNSITITYAIQKDSFTPATATRHEWTRQR
jgi:hypothetical protein